jgi:hypothetical protein
MAQLPIVSTKAEEVKKNAKANEQNCFWQLGPSIPESKSTHCLLGASFYSYVPSQAK